MEVIKEQVAKNLREVYDPELSVNVYDLGLIYDIDLSSMPHAVVTHTLTSAFCPSADDIIEDIRAATVKSPGIKTCEVVTTFDPPFGPEMMSEETRLLLGLWDD